MFVFIRKSRSNSILTDNNKSNIYPLVEVRNVKNIQLLSLRVAGTILHIIYKNYIYTYYEESVGDRFLFYYIKPETNHDDDGDKKKTFKKNRSQRSKLYMILYKNYIYHTYL